MTAEGHRIAFLLTLGAMGLTLILIGLGTMMPGTQTVSVHRPMAVAPEDLHRSLCDLRQWPTWSAWSAEHDGTATWTFEGAPHTEGQRLAWQGDHIGDGVLTVTHLLSPHGGLEYTLTFADGPPSSGSITLRPTSQGTDLHWTNEIAIGGNPVMRLLGPFIGDRHQADLVLTLDGLQARLEAP
jgi:hypothetical protein